MVTTFISSRGGQIRGGLSYSCCFLIFADRIHDSKQEIERNSRFDGVSARRHVCHLALRKVHRHREVRGGRRSWGVSTPPEIVLSKCHVGSFWESVCTTLYRQSDPLKMDLSGQKTPQKKDVRDLMTSRGANWCYANLEQIDHESLIMSHFMLRLMFCFRMTLQDPSLVYHPLGSARARNPGITTEVVGNIIRAKTGQETGVPRYSAICTLDGMLLSWSYIIFPVVSSFHNGRLVMT